MGKGKKKKKPGKLGARSILRFYSGDIATKRLGNKPSVKVAIKMAAAIRNSMLLVVVIGGWSALFASAKPPAPPVQCDGSGCVLSNAYGAWVDRQLCRTGHVVFPTTEEELRVAVSEARRERLKAKAASGFSHTIPKLACPPPENSVVISTAEYNSRIEVGASHDLIDFVSRNRIRLLLH